MRILVFEPDHSGHHFPYVRLLASAFLEAGATVIIATSAAARDSASYRMYLSSLEGSATIDACLPPLTGGPLAVARSKLGALASSVDRARPDYVCIPYADGLAQLLTVAGFTGRRALRSVLCGGLVMRGPFAYPANGTRGRLRAAVSWRLIEHAPLDDILVIDPIVYEAVQRRGGAFARKVMLAPEPIEVPPPMDRRAARRFLNIPENGHIIACAGVIDRRKGCDLLLRAFADARLAPDDRLLLVGSHDAEVRALIGDSCAGLVRSGRLLSIDRFVEPEELGAAISAADLVCTPYPRHIGSASIVIRAAAAGRPVVASRFGWVRWAVERFALGRTCDVENAEEFAVVLAEELDRAGSYVPSAAADRWIKFHTPENFVRTWLGPVSQRMGLPAPIAPHYWQWVERGDCEGSAAVGPMPMRLTGNP